MPTLIPGQPPARAAVLTWLLIVVTLNGVAFAPTRFNSEAACKAAAGAVAVPIARADQNLDGARLSCVSVSED